MYKLLTIFVYFTLGCGLFVSKQSDDSGFDLIFKYGVGARNELNTFEGTYTKDMVIDPPITADLSLTQEELDGIYQRMLEINFFEYPDTFSVFVEAGEDVAYFTPFSTYYFKILYDSKIKELWWSDNIFKAEDDEKANGLRELIKFIREIVESKEEYKNLPPARGGYF